MKRALICIIFCLSVTGCATNSLFGNYPSQIRTQKQALNSSQPESELSELTEKISGNDGLLYAQEAGRVAQIAGDFKSSKTFYQQAIRKYTALDNKAVISASDVGANASSLLLNDNVIPYQGTGFERIMLHQYQALNYVFAGDFRGALVEVRRANELQQIEQDKYAESKKSVSKLENGVVDQQIRKFRNSTGSVTSSFLNAYSYYVTGLLHEILGKANDAFIDYRKAAEIWPDNPYVEHDLVRLAKQLSMPQYPSFKRRFGNAPIQQSGQGELILIYEKGFVQAKDSIDIPFTIHGKLQTISLPTYNFSAAPVGAAPIRGLNDPYLNASAITSIDALAINALRENYPVILARQAARVYAKSELAKSISSGYGHKNGDWELGSIAVQLFNVVTESADQRSWLTLPNQAQIARAYLNSGEYPLAIAQSRTHNITIKPGRKTLVWAINTGNYTRFYSIII